MEIPIDLTLIVTDGKIGSKNLSGTLPDVKIFLRIIVGTAD